MRRKFMTLIFAVIFIFASCPVFADNLPAQFDLLSCNRVPSRTTHQKFTEACWAFASVASLESTYMTKFNAEDPDLSEMFVAYFVYGDPREGKSFPNIYNFSNVLNIGGIASFAEAFMSKAGIVKDSVLPFNISQTPDKLPEEYESSGIRLSETCNFGKYYLTDDLEPCLKELIFNYGAVYVAYYTNSSGYSTFTDSDNYQAKAYYHNGYITSGHAVAVIGWDDNFSRENFQASMRPSRNRAWLIRNSNPDNGGGSLFWMSYEQSIWDANLFIADKSSEKLKHYGYDELGVSTSYFLLCK